MRPPKARTIVHIPECRRFRPCPEKGESRATENGISEDPVTIGLDMLEAMRLVDVEGMKQEEAARNMEVSAPTLCRILGQGRRLAALALTTGKTINIEGGNIMCMDTMQGQHGHRCRRGHGGQTAHAMQATEAICSHDALGRNRRKGHGNRSGRVCCSKNVAGENNTNVTNNA